MQLNLLRLYKKIMATQQRDLDEQHLFDKSLVPQMEHGHPQPGGWDANGIIANSLPPSSKPTIQIHNFSKQPGPSGSSFYHAIPFHLQLIMGHHLANNMDPMRISALFRTAKYHAQLYQMLHLSITFMIVFMFSMQEILIALHLPIKLSDRQHQNNHLTKSAVLRCDTYNFQPISEPESPLPVLTDL